MEEQKYFTGRTIIGLILVIIGGSYLLGSFDIIPDRIVSIIISWPSLLVVIGMVNLINARNKGFGTILVIIGGIFLLRRIVPEFHINDDLVFPMVLIGIGSLLIFRKKKTNQPFTFHEDKTISSERLDDVSIFGGGHKTINTQEFKGGNITAIFGGSEIDLTDCKLAPGENILDIVVIFGGIELIVPEDWKILIDVTPIFGGFSNKYRRDPNMVVDPTALLRIKGTVIFGGGEIKVRGMQSH
ncbi:MAG: cell wall-active antibiotics response protein [Ignavibacteria bacterium]|nr:cell wall-active antibiotics response protein [Ignavibacteria bacterium]